jgi:hypothetical protein
MHAVKQSSWSVCLVESVEPATQEEVVPGGGEAAPDQADTEAVDYNREAWKPMIQRALEDWLAQLRSFSGQLLVSEIKIIGTEDGCTTDLKNDDGVSVVKIFAAQGLARSFYQPSDRFAKVSVDKRIQGTLLHELGHAFGLDDAYFEEGGNKPGQPESVMSGRIHQEPGGDIDVHELTADDIEGVRWLYCSLYRSDNPSGCEALRSPGVVLPEAVPGAALFQLSGVTASDFTTTHYRAVAYGNAGTSAAGVRIRKNFATRAAAESFLSNYDPALHLIAVDETSDHGALVTAVQEGSPAAVAGLTVGHIIVRLQGQEIDSRASLAKAIATPNYAPRLVLEVTKFDSAQEEAEAGTGLGLPEWLDVKFP